MNQKPNDICVSIVDDDETLSSTLSVLISGDPGMTLVSVYSNPVEAVARLPKDGPHVVIMDLQMPGMTGIQAIAKLKPLMQDTQFLVLTSHCDDEEVFDSLMAGATGYLLKRSSSVEILQAISEIHNGGSPMSSYIARLVVQSYMTKKKKAGQKSDAVSSLSPRETEIVSLLSQGHLYKEIADELNISLETVRTHIRRVYEKLQVSTRTEAAVKYLGLW